MADLVQGTDIQTVFLPDGSVLVTQEGAGDVGVASADYWQWDDVLTGIVEPGTWCFGHSTNVSEDNYDGFDVGSGNAQEYLTGDNNFLCIDSGDEWISPILDVGTASMEIVFDIYQTGTGTEGTIQYKTGTSSSDCNADTWNAFSGSFTPEGFAQLRFKKP